jgi:hypothetical protein
MNGQHQNKPHHLQPKHQPSTHDIIDIPVQVIAPPWYDAVDAAPSGAHVNGLLEALEKNPGLHDRAHVSATAPVCLPCSEHLDVTTTELAGKFVGLSHVSSSHAWWPPSALEPDTTTPK